MGEHVQVKLRDGTTVLTCWVDRVVKVGDRVTLKHSENPDRWWTVVTVSAETRERPPHQPWKVGGLK